MKQALFVRTQDLQLLLDRVRAREITPTLLLESQMAARMASVLLSDQGGDGAVLADTARELVPLLTAEKEREPTLAPLWDALDGIRALGLARLGDGSAGRQVARALGGWHGSLDPDERKRIGQWMEKSFAGLREADPAAYSQLGRLLRGEIRAVAVPVTGESPEPASRGRRTVLAGTADGEHQGPLPNQTEARELLRWRAILTDLLPPDCRPARRLVVPGGIGCSDLEGPTLSWKATAGILAPDEMGCFEAHLLSCDLCFEFHYRARWALDVLRKDGERILVQEAAPEPEHVPGRPRRQEGEPVSLWKRILGRGR